MTAAAWRDEEEQGWRTWMARDAAQQSLVTWSPALLAAGIWGYFALAAEPPILLFAAIGAGGLLLVLLSARSGSRPALIVAMIVAGFCLAKLRAELVQPDLLTASTGKISITALVERVEERGPRRAVMIADVSGHGRIRLTLNGMVRPKPGERIRAEAMLMPLPVPVMPGGFDFGRMLYFEGIGGTGRIIGAPVTEGREPGIALALGASLHDLRAGIGDRIGAVLPDNLRGFGEALITGERGRIPKEVNDSLQASGLAHVLSISGLHMSLVAGGMFWLVRALLALFPNLPQRRPIKKWAAVAALATGFLYMLLAGADVATQRSFVMIAIMFLAVLIDRPALSMRNLSLAALLILVSQPEAAVAAGFQMSFLAVAGLVAFFEAFARYRRRRLREPSTVAFVRLAQKTAFALLAMAATTLIAGALSSIPAAYHFGRLAPLSILGNGLALPIISLIVMPAALISALLMPLGLEAIPLWVMGEGLKLVMAVSDWVAALPGARLHLAQPSALQTFGLAMAAIGVCLWQGRLRSAFLCFLVLVFVPQARGPDLLIEATAANVALRGEDGLLVFAAGKGGRFAAEKWLLAEGDAAKPAEAARRNGWSCENFACQALVRGKRVVYLKDGAVAPAFCGRADVLISSFPLRGACRNVPVRVDRFDVWKQGAMAISLDMPPRIDTSRGMQGERPWVVTPVPRKRALTKF